MVLSSCLTDLLIVHDIVTVHSAAREMVPYHTLGEKVFELPSRTF